MKFDILLILMLRRILSPNWEPANVIWDNKKFGAILWGILFWNIIRQVLSEMLVSLSHKK